MNATAPDALRALATLGAITVDSAILLNELLRLLEPMPAKLAPLLALESDPAKARAIIDNEIRRVRYAFRATEAALLKRLHIAVTAAS